MSLGFQLEKINKAFEQITIWYKEFMNRTNECFKTMHARQLELEERVGQFEHQNWQGPTDEQLERVLRKILAERFADPRGRSVDGMDTTKETPRFLDQLKEDLIYPRPLPLDLASLQVDVMAVPSEKYAQDMRMLQGGLEDYPSVNMKAPTPESLDRDTKHRLNDLRQSETIKNHDKIRLWS